MTEVPGSDVRNSESRNSDVQDAMDWLKSQKDVMLQFLVELCDQNSGTYHAEGVAKVADQLQTAYQTFAERVVRQETPPAVQLNDRGQEEMFPLGPNLIAEARCELPRRFFLCIHMDTVYGLDHPFQTCRNTEPGILNGPGVIDAKGGQVVMLYALQAFERTAAARKIGWRVFMNPDEEIGSLGSTPLLHQLAEGSELGLLFEPVLPDGSMVAARKGSGNFTLVCRGRGAHSGRDFEKGRNAIVHLSRVLIEIDELNQSGTDVTYNVGRVQGGGPVNMVPDLAVARLNIRASTPEQCEEAMKNVQEIVNRWDAAADYSVSLEGHFSSPPKVVDPGTLAIQQVIEKSARKRGLAVSWRNTGGASDGNKLSGIGIPNVDTLGPVGDHLHSEREYLVVDSLLERTQLALQILVDLAESKPIQA